MSKESQPSLLQQYRYADFLVSANGGPLMDHGAKNLNIVLGNWQRGQTLFVNTPDGELGVRNWEMKEDGGEFSLEQMYLYKIFAQNGYESELLNDISLFSEKKSDKNEQALDIYQLPRQELIDLMRGRVGSLLEAVEISLDVGHVNGFNRHGMDHMDKVCQRSLEIADTIGADEDTVKTLIITTYLHDVGNLLSRKLHSLVSIKMAKLIVPEISQDKQFERRIRRAIALHNEPIADLMIASIMDELQIKEISENEDGFYEEVVKRFGKEGLTILIADKSDAINRDRVSLKVKDGQVAVDSDVHFEISALATTKNVQIEADKAGLQIDFDPTVAVDDPYCKLYGREDKEAVRKYDNPVKRRPLKIPKETKDRRKLEGVPYFYQWLNKTFEHHLGRFKLMAMATFALNPNIDKFELDFSDADGFTDKKDGVNFKICLSRGDLDKQIQTLQYMKDYKNVKKLHAEMASDVFGRVEFESAELWQKETEIFGGLVKVSHRFSKSEDPEKLNSFLEMMYGMVSVDANRQLAPAGD